MTEDVSSLDGMGTIVCYFCNLDSFQTFALFERITIQDSQPRDATIVLWTRKTRFLFLHELRDKILITRNV